MPEHFVDPAMDMISKVMLKRDKLQAKVDELEKENQRLRDRIDLAENRYVELLAENQRLRGLLRKMPEWVYDKDQECYFCEVCGSNKDYGHLKNCELAKELSDD